MEIINKKLLDEVSTKAKASPRLRKNYNFHQSLDELCHRFLNAVEPSADTPIHHHPTKEDAVILLRGRVRMTTDNDNGTIIDCIVLNLLEGNYGVNIAKNVCHTVEALEPSSSKYRMRRKAYLQKENSCFLKS